MLASIIRFEWRYHTRQISFVVAAAIFFLIGFALTATAFGAKNLNLNSPYNITESLGLASLASLFVVAVFCANAVLRDREFAMEEIVFSTAVEKFPYLFGRFLGSFLASFTVFSVTVAGMLLSLAMPWQDPAKIGPLHPVDYLWPLCVLILPSMLAATATLFTIAILTRSMLASVVGAVGLYILYFVVAALTNSPLMAASRTGADTIAAAAIFDPFGLSAFFEQTRYWIPAQRNVQLASLRGTFLLNRLFCLGLTAAFWLLAFQRFSFRVASGDSRAVKAKRRSESTNGPGGMTGQYESAAVSIDGFRFQWRALISSTKLEVRSFAGSLPFFLLTLLWIGLAASELASDIGGGEYGSALYPTTGFLLSSLQQPLSLLAAIILIYYSAEIIWRERTVGMAEVINATPPSGWVFVLSKWLALSAMVAILIATGTGTAVVLQITHGYTRLDPGLMLAFAYFGGMPLLLLAMAAVFIQVLSPQKYAGLLVVVLVAVFMRAGVLTGLEHPLLRFGATPPLQYAEMNGFGGIAGYNWFNGLWLSAGTLLLVLASMAWRSSPERGRGSFLADWRSQPAGSRSLAGLLFLLSTSMAAFIFYNTNVLNAWSGTDATLRWRADYEMQYKAVASTAQPATTKITATASLYPRERRYHVAGQYTLLNQSRVPISRLLVAVRKDARRVRLSLSSAVPDGRDSRFAQTWFRFEPPLAPGKQASLQFELSFEGRGFSADGEDSSIAGNGSFILDQRCLPSLGYRRSYEIADSADRKKYGLPPIAVPGESEEAPGTVDPIRDEWVNLDLTLSTDGDQIAIAPGTLERKWSAGGRNYFHYRTPGPVHRALAFVSGRYEQATTNEGGTVVEIDFDRDHAWNVPRMLKAATLSLRYFGENFGPYRGRELRIVEVPSYLSFGGYAHPGVIYVADSRGFLTDSRDPDRIDLVTRRIAHEVAHQWWGHLVSPAPGPGASAIVETLAKYSELTILEKTDGPRQVTESLRRELDLYLAGRTSSEGAELPLSGVGDQSWLYYRKGAVVMYAIRDLIGEKAMNDALKRFVTSEGGPGHHAYVRDLVDRLDEVSTPEQRALIDEWMNEVVLYDLSMQSARARRLADGRYAITMEIKAGKRRSTGTPLILNEDIDVGIVSGDPEGQSQESTAQILRVRLHEGMNTITVVLKGFPATASVDTRLTRIDPDQQDNRRPVEIIASDRTSLAYPREAAH